jgi:putative tricarboxylic transport membrane protein
MGLPASPGTNPLDQTVIDVFFGEGQASRKLQEEEEEEQRNDIGQRKMQDTPGGATVVAQIGQPTLVITIAIQASGDYDPNTGRAFYLNPITGKPQVGMDKITPIARLTSEFNVFVVPGDSPLKSMKDVVEQMKKDPASVKWGGGSRGSTEHICASMLATKVGVDPKKVNYVAFRGGGEAIAAVLGGNVTVGGSGYSEFAEYIKAGKMRPIGVTSAKRLPGIDVPTLKELGFDVVLGNWRAVYGAPGITSEQRAALTELVVKATKSKSWQEALERNTWTPALLTGKAFDDFVDDEFANLRGIMHLSGMV